MARDINYNGGAMNAHYRKMKRYIREDNAADKAARQTWSKEQKAAQAGINAQNAIKCKAVSDNSAGLITYAEMREITIAANQEIERLRAIFNAR